MTLQSSEDGVKRPYNAPRRAAQAEATRIAILEAAADLFNAQGFTQTTIKQIADRAAVSEQTVYNIFDDKIGVLYAGAMHVMETGTGDPEIELIEALQAEPDPLLRIRIAARATREIWESGALELEQLVASPDIKDTRLIELSEKTLAHTLEMTRVMVELLYPDAIRRGDTSLEEIAEYFTAVDTGATVNKLLRLGWTLEDYEQWVVKVLTLFLDPEFTTSNAPPGAESGAGTA